MWASTWKSFSCVREIWNVSQWRLGDAKIFQNCHIFIVDICFVCFDFSQKIVIIFAICICTLVATECIKYSLAFYLSELFFLSLTPSLSLAFFLSLSFSRSLSLSISFYSSLCLSLFFAHSLALDHVALIYSTIFLLFSNFPICLLSFICHMLLAPLSFTWISKRGEKQHIHTQKKLCIFYSLLEVMCASFFLVCRLLFIYCCSLLSHRNHNSTTLVLYL